MLLNSITEFDQQFFSLINNVLTSDFLDILLVPWRNQYFWIPLYIFILSFLIINFKKKSYWYLFFLFLTVGLTDTVSSAIMKPLIERPRPCHEESGIDNVRLLVRCGSGYSFTSSHATNHFGVAFFLIFTLGVRRKYVFLPLFFWAFLVAYAQVYVGVHYPLDVICGAVLGTGIALLTSELYGYFLRKMELTRIEV